MLIPAQNITFLGNDIDSTKMIVTLPKNKTLNIKKECNLLIQAKMEKIRTVARIIGLLVASFSAVQYGKMHYRTLEREKITALKINQGNYDAKMNISSLMKSELSWWVDNIDTQFRKITHGNPDITIQTDASLRGYGMVLGSVVWGGKWSDEECTYHINVLELLAVLYALKAFRNQVKNKHVKILTDSITAMACIKNMGSQKSLQCDKVSLDIWNWCIKNDVWVSCNHIPGTTNEADRPSRKFEENLEWMLDKNIFVNICDKLEKPCIDLFASKVNKQLPMYCAWKIDQNTKYIDAMSFSWNSF